MRFIVEYTRPSRIGLVEGVRMFDVINAKKANEPVVLAAAQQVAGGPTATIISLKENDGRTDLGEKVVE